MNDGRLTKKIQAILSYASDGQHNAEDSFVDYVTTRKPQSFTYYFRRKATGRIEHGISSAQIQATVELCIALKLMALTNGTYRLTRQGVSAREPLRFGGVVRPRVVEYLAQNHCNLELIERTVTTMLRQRPPVLPTLPDIFEHVATRDTSIAPESFARALQLLAECNGIHVSQRRIYLPST